MGGPPKKGDIVPTPFWKSAPCGVGKASNAPIGSAKIIKLAIKVTTNTVLQAWCFIHVIFKTIRNDAIITKVPSSPNMMKTGLGGGGGSKI